MILGGLTDGSWWVIRETKPWLSAWDFPPRPPSSGKRREVGDWVIDQSYLWGKPSIKIPKVWIFQSFQVSEHIHIPGGGFIPTPWGQMCHRPFLISPMYLFIWLYICILYHIPLSNKPVNVSEFSLSSVNYCSKGWNPRKGSWERQICNQVRQKSWVTWGFTTCLKWRAVLWNRAFILWGLL